MMEGAGRRADNMVCRKIYVTAFACDSFVVLTKLVVLFNFRIRLGKELRDERQAGTGRDERRARRHGTGRGGRWTRSRWHVAQRARIGE